MTRAQNTAVSTGAENRNFFESYADAAAGSRIVGDLLRFNKGDYLAGQDQNEVAIGTRLVANMDELMIGWNRWQDGQVTDMHMGRIADGFVPPARNTLGDDDEDAWEKDEESGEPRDPWAKTNLLILKEEKGDQLYTFAVSAKGSLSAIGKLCGVYGKSMRSKPDEFPVIELGVGKYKHKNAKYGWVKFPELDVVGWAQKSVFEGALTAASGPGEEDEAEPTPTARASGKAAATADTCF